MKTTKTIDTILISILTILTIFIAYMAGTFINSRTNTEAPIHMNYLNGGDKVNTGIFSD